ncbi:SDR family NAD(P)-dependent oxidoreductase [bacterium]|nr:SDR family NAD(P)-dependent oxidoreductase [bacterium]
MTFQGDVVWVIGASSGIGAEVAKSLMKSGATVAVSARRAGVLDALLAPYGGEHMALPLDVTNPDAVVSVMQAIQQRYGRVDRVILLAADYLPMRLGALDLQRVRQVVSVNVLGTFHVIEAVLTMARSQSHRIQLAICGSVAGYVGLPAGQPYSATKAAVINVVESLAAEHGHRLDVRLISPGFVDTPLTAHNTFDMPCIISSSQAARYLLTGLLGHAFEIHFPKRFTYALKVIRCLPYAILLPLLRWLNQRAG